LTTAQPARITTHLPPEDAPKLKRTAATTAKAQQSSEHDNQQEKVGAKQGNESRFTGIEVGHFTSIYQRKPYGANLWMDTVRQDGRMIEID
jgi:hypothetical protein